MSLKLQLLSDLHQEFYKEQILKKEDVVGDVLLLAGDITAGSRDITYIEKFNVPTYYCLGNHEHYGRHWKECIEEYRSMFGYGSHNVHMMENDTVFLDNGRVRLVACSMWTSFMAPVPEGVIPLFSAPGEVPVEGREEHQGFYCKQMMADFYEIKGITISGWTERHQYSVDYLKLILSQKHNGPTIVMTHHAPSFKSSLPRYHGNAINGGFCVNMEWLMEEYKPELWVHGHCHNSSDYHVGSTRVLANPRGYHKENAGGFQPHLIVEI